MAYQCRRTYMEWICEECGKSHAHYPMRDGETGEADVELMKRWYCCNECHGPFPGRYVAISGVNERRAIRGPSGKERRRERRRWQMALLDILEWRVGNLRDR